MQKYSVQQYTEIKSKLPQAIIDGVLSYDTTLKVEEIGVKHKLQIDQIGILVDIIQDIGYGILASKDFLETLKAELELPQEELLLLASDINDQIFKPVRAEMLKTFKDEAPNKPRTISTIDENDTHHETLSKADILSEIENPHPVVRRQEVCSGQRTVSSEQFVVGSKKEMGSEKLVVDSKKETLQTSAPSPSVPNLSTIHYPLPTSSAVSADIRARFLSSLGEDKLSHVVTMKKAKEVGSGQVVFGSKKETLQASTPAPVLPTTNLPDRQAGYQLSTSSPVSPKLQALSEVKTKIKDPFREVGSEQFVVGSKEVLPTSPHVLEPANYKLEPSSASSTIIDPYREQIN